MGFKTPKELKYTVEHEWTLIEGDTLTVGITDYAQSALGDIVFVELPEEGSTLEKGTSFGVVESIKSVSDLYAPITGTVLEVNGELEQQPDLCNKDPYGSWMVKLKIGNKKELEELLSADAYASHCASL